MKRRFVLSIIVFMALMMVWSTFARAEETSAGRRERAEGDRPTARGARPAAPRAQGRRVPGLLGLSPEEREKMRERWQNMPAEEREKFRAEMRERFGSVRGPSGRTDTPRVFEQQIAQLKAEQQKTINELREILDLARKEKAAQTAKRVEQLISKRQKAFQERLQALEQRRQRFERARPQRPEARREPDRAAMKRAPDFTLNCFEGKQVSLAQQRGKIVVLEWLNFECPFSLYHHKTRQTMVDLAKKYKDKNVVWFAVNSTSHTTAEANQAFAKKYKLPYPILNDKPGKVGKEYGAKTTPHMIIIDSRGRIAYDGAIDNAPNGKIPQGQKYVNYVSEALDAVIANRRVTTAQTKPYGCTVKYPK